MRPPSTLDVAELLSLAALLLGFRMVRGAQETRSQERITPIVEAAYAAYDADRGPRAEPALDRLANVLRREEADWAGTAYGKRLAFELCLTYGRLGLLAGGAAEERGDFAAAHPWCQGSGKPAVADAVELRATLAEIDDNEGAVDDETREREAASR